MRALSALRAAFGEAVRMLRPRRRRTILGALGIALAAAMLSAAVVVGDGLGLGFDRAARAADLPDIIARFNAQPLGRVGARIAALPDVAGYSLRFEATNTRIAGRGHERGDAVAEVVDPGRRRGYAIVAGRDLRPGRPEVLLERGFAQAWGVHLGDTVYLGRLGPQSVVGFVEAPDNVGFPLAKPRFYISRQEIEQRFDTDHDPDTNLAEIWLRNPRYLDEVLVQARATSFGLHDIRFATRSGLRVLLDQAAGIVIDLLVALSVIALVTAGAMLAASAQSRGAAAAGHDRGTASGGSVARACHAVARGRGAAGRRSRRHDRAGGRSAGHVRPRVAPADAAERAAAGNGARAPARGRVAAQRRDPRRRHGVARVDGRRRLGRRAAARGDVSASGAGARRLSLRGRGLRLLGARLVAARRVRLVATVVTLGLSTAFVLLMLALASALSALETDPGALGKRYQLTASLAPDLAPRVRAIPGVQASAPRYEVLGADSFSLGETINVIAYPSDHTEFEAPPLVSGRRLRGSHEAEVGAGLAAALGLAPGSTLALALPAGTELRLRVSGVVSSLDHDGRMAFVPASALLAADPSAPSQIAVRLVPGASPARVTAALRALGARPSQATTAVGRGAPLVAVLRTILRAVAIVDGLVCLYALIQACALTVQERRRTVAVLRACGAGPAAVRQLLLGAALALVLPAAVVGVLLERLLFGPALARLAASYATLPLQATLAEVLATLGGLAIAAAVAVAWVARQAGRESVVAELAG